MRGAKNLPHREHHEESQREQQTTQPANARMNRTRRTDNILTTLPVRHLPPSASLYARLRLPRLALTCISGQRV